jgi:hypothetical protein
MQFVTKNKSLININIEYDNKMIIQANSVKLFGITVNNTLSWKQHIDASIPKLTLCRSNLNPYCLGRKAAFFSVGI